MKRTLMILALAAVSCVAHAQDRTTPYDRTPNASSIAKYANIPVSGANGQAQVSIPIYSTTQNGVTLDVNLTYDTSGYTISGLAGWTGHGWTLNAGGCITRVKNQICDEMCFPFIYNNFECYFKRYNYLTTSTVPQQSIRPNENVPVAPLEITQFYNYLNASGDRYDLEPDMFYFNFLGISGKFFLGNDGEWKVMSDSNIDVILDIETNKNNNFAGNEYFCYPLINSFPSGGNQPLSIKKIILVDDSGNKYTFGSSQNAIEYTISLDGCKSQEDPKEPWSANTWYLSSVSDRFGNLLYSFTYERGRYIIQMYNTGTTSAFHYWGNVQAPSYLKSISVQDGTTLSFDTCIDSIQTTRRIYPDFYLPNGNAKTDLWASNSSYTYISDICTHDLSYLFSNTLGGQYSSPGRTVMDPLSAMELRTLRNISIYSGGQAPFLKYQFNYDYTGRIHLSELSMSGGNSLLGKYTFDYYQYHKIPSSYLDVSKDTWGYFKPSFSSSSNNQPHEPYDPIAPHDESRTATMPDSLVYFQFGMLKSITYPTGGVVELEYEKHDNHTMKTTDRAEMTFTDVMAGGTRIKSVSEFLSGNLVSKRDFYYRVPSADGSGIYGLSAVSSGELFSNPARNRIEMHNGTMYEKSDLVSADPLSNSYGSHIGYSYVTEVMMDGTYKTSHFYNISDTEELYLYTIPDGLKLYAKPTEYCYKRGKLIDEKTYSANGSIAASIVNTYRQDVASHYSQNFVYACNLIERGGGYVGSVYKLLYPKYDLARSVTTIYRNGTAQTVTEKEYKYKDCHATVSGLPGITAHHADFRLLTEEKETRSGMTQSKRLNYFLADTCKFFMPVNSTTTYCNGTFVSKDSVAYRMFSNGHYHPCRQIRCAGTLQESIVTAYDDYDSRGRLVEFTNAGSCTTRLYWDDNNRLKAKITCPYPFEQIQFLSPYTYRYQGRSIFEHPAIDATVYNYDDRGRVTTSVTGNGNAMHYDYDASNRLTQIKDHNNDIIQTYTYKYDTGE